MKGADILRRLLKRGHETGIQAFVSFFDFIPGDLKLLAVPPVKSGAQFLKGFFPALPDVGNDLRDRSGDAARKRAFFPIEDIVDADCV